MGNLYLFTFLPHCAPPIRDFLDHMCVMNQIIMAALRSRCRHYIFILWSLLYTFFKWYHISAVSGPTFAILCRHMEEILLFNKLFSHCRYVPSLQRYSVTNLCDGAQMANFWRFLHRIFSASRVQHISDLHPKFALRPHHVWKYGRHPMCDG